jgi:hypothetical protein
MARRLRLPRKYNPMAKALASPLYRQRTVPARRGATPPISATRNHPICAVLSTTFEIGFPTLPPSGQFRCPQVRCQRHDHRYALTPRNES